MKIGIVGNGFVGSSVAFGFSPQTGCDADVKIYDKDDAKSTHSLEEVVNTSDFIFVSTIFSILGPSNLIPIRSDNLETVNSLLRKVSLPFSEK